MLKNTIGISIATLISFTTLLFSQLAMAQAAAAKPQPSLLEFLILPAGFIFIFYFLMLRPQQKKLKEHQSMLGALKVGDEIVTTGGIIGKIKAVAESFVTLEVGNNTAIKVLKSNVSNFTKDNKKPAKA